MLNTCCHPRLTISLIVTAALIDFAAAQLEPTVSIGYLAANGAAVTVASGATVYHVTMEDSASGYASRMRFWCAGLVAEGGWDICRWTRPGLVGGCTVFGTIASCNNDVAGGFTYWTVRQTPNAGGPRCDIEVVGANGRDTGDWTCLLIARQRRAYDKLIFPTFSCTVLHCSFVLYCSPKERGLFAKCSCCNQQLLLAIASLSKLLIYCGRTQLVNRYFTECQLMQTIKRSFPQVAT